MHKSKQNEQVRSPSITPQNATSKQTITKKKPPAHAKLKSQEKSLKLSQKAKKNRTNSITPKTLKSSVYDRIFHNSNLSETDITSKIIEVSRPTSKISKSLINRLELTQKVKDFKKPAPFIDQIIRKSLNRAKKLKQSQEKENRKFEIKKEIKKHEMNFQNQQIRLENSLKCKKRKKSNKKTEGKTRSESSSKVRNFASLFYEPAGKNKRSVSIGEYYSGYDRRSDTAILDYIQDKNNRRIEEENFEYLQQRAAEISKAERLHSLEVFTKNQRIKSPKARKVSSKSYSESEEKPEVIVERNISFIEDSSIESLSLDEEKPTTSDYDNLKEGRSGNLGIYSEDSLEDPRVGAAVLIQRAYRRHLISRLLKKSTLSFYYSKPVQVLPHKKTLAVQNRVSKISVQAENRKKTLSIFQSNSIQIPKKTKNLKFDCQPPLKIRAVAKRLFAVSAQTSDQIFAKPKNSKNFISRQYSFTVFPDKQSKSDSGQIHDLLKEQIAWNSAQVFIIEQLRFEEISTLGAVEDREKREKLIEAVHRKYQNLLSVLKEAAEFSQSDYLENLSVEEYSKLEKNKQNKQEVLNKVLFANKESLNKPVLPLKIDLVESNDQGVQLSSDLSSDEGETRLGISHSRSLSQLHGDGAVGKYISSSQSKESSNSKFPIFFEIDEPIEVQSVSLLSSDFPLGPGKNLPPLPSLPMLHLDYMQKEAEYSEPRILTSTDSILDFVKAALGKLDFTKVLKELKNPLERNIEDELFKLQEKVVGTPSETRIFDFPLLFNYSDLLSDEESSKELETTLRQISQSDKIHKKMLLDVLNVQLQQFRPNGFEGKPLGWSDKQVGFARSLKAGEITEKVLKDMEIFSLFQIGRIFNEEMITSNGGIDDGLIQSLREDRLERLIYFETLEEEVHWIDYEFEETQVKFDVSDMILECLLDELEEKLGN